MQGSLRQNAVSFIRQFTFDITSSKMAIVALLVSLACVAVLGQRRPPVLPSMWVAETIDPPEPEGVEAYYFVDNPTEDNPSAMWSNYSDCQRLIYDTNDLEFTGR